MILTIMPNVFAFSQITLIIITLLRLSEGDQKLYVAEQLEIDGKMNCYLINSVNMIEKNIQNMRYMEKRNNKNC